VWHKNYVHCASIMFNAFRPHLQYYVQNYAGIIPIIENTYNISTVAHNQLIQLNFLSDHTIQINYHYFHYNTILLQER